MQQLQFTFLSSFSFRLQKNWNMVIIFIAGNMFGIKQHSPTTILAAKSQDNNTVSKPVNAFWMCSVLPPISTTRLHGYCDRESV